MKKRTLGYIFKLPLYLIILGSFIASVYAAAKETFNITFTTPFIIAIIIILYIIGEIFIYKSKNNLY